LTQIARGTAADIDAAVAAAHAARATSPARALPDGRPAVDIAHLKAPVDPRRLTIVEPRQLTLAL
jgi:hypothetical protein